MLPEGYRTDIDIFDPSNFDKQLCLTALNYRRACIDRSAEISIQTALADQHEAEALRSEECAENESPTEAIKNCHIAKAIVMRENAKYARARAGQAQMELNAMVDNAKSLVVPL